MNGPFDTATDITSQTEAACELFAGKRHGPTFEWLKGRCRSPLQVPFYYLKLVRRGRVSALARSPAPTAAQVELAYRVILQRPPESRAAVLHQIRACENLGRLIAGLLTSEEAVTRMPELHARAFPLARRLWHVHIPKTGGSSFFAAAVEGGWGYVNTNKLQDAVGDLEGVAGAVRLGPKGSAIVSGHWLLTRFGGSIGPFDRVVVFVRDPVELCLSEFNYAVDVVQGRENVHAATPEAFLQRGLVPGSFSHTFERGFFQPNMQCARLSDQGTCESALRNLAGCQAELLPHDAVDRTIERYFPAARRQRVNVSNKHVHRAEVEPSMRARLILSSGHDFLLHEVARLRSHRQAATSASGEHAAASRGSTRARSCN
jgi:hypothetical protein